MSRAMMVPRRVAIVGAGQIGAGWAALFAAHGADVRVVDPDPRAMERAMGALELAIESRVGPGEAGRIDAVSDVVAATEDAEWVQESVPEDLQRKRRVLSDADAAAPPNAIIGTSTSTFTIRELTADDRSNGRTIVAHPLHPVYAVPLVELCGGPATTPDVLPRAAGFLQALGRDPVVIRGELPGLVANRLTAALLREAFDLIARGAIDAQSLDRIVARGVALGWATDGPLMTEAIGLGSGSLEGLPDRLERTLARLWPSLAAWPALDEAARRRVRIALAACGRRGELVD